MTWNLKRIIFGEKGIGSEGRLDNCRDETWVVKDANFKMKIKLETSFEETDCVIGIQN